MLNSSKIRAAVLEVCELPPRMLASPSKESGLVIARHIFIWLLCTELSWSPRRASAQVNRDRTLAYHVMRGFEARVESDAHFRNVLRRVRQQLEI